MILTILLILCAIMLILALLYILGCLVAKHLLSRRKKYQEHIDDMVEELFPSSIQTPAVQTLPDTDSQWEDEQYRETKRKINAAIAKILGPDELAPVNPYSKQTFLTPPCIERLME